MRYFTSYFRLAWYHTILEGMQLRSKEVRVCPRLPSEVCRAVSHQGKGRREGGRASWFGRSNRDEVQRCGHVGAVYQCEIDKQPCPASGFARKPAAAGGSSHLSQATDLPGCGEVGFLQQTTWFRCHHCPLLGCGLGKEPSGFLSDLAFSSSREPLQ